jgi:hypothetical protein
MKEDKNPATKSRLYKKTLIVVSIYIGSRPGISNASRALYNSLLKVE